MGRNYDLIKSSNSYRCERIATHGIKTGQIDRNNLVFASHPTIIQANTGLGDRLKEMDELKKIAVLFKRDPDFCAPEGMGEESKQLLQSGAYDMVRQ